MTRELQRPDSAGTEAAHPALLANLRSALEEAGTLPEITALVDRAEVIRVAARKAHLSAEAQNDWAEYRLDAERKAGHMLARLDGFGRGRKSVTVTDLGVSHNQSKRWQAIAALPDEQYQSYKQRSRAAGEVTERGALQEARKFLIDQKLADLVDRAPRTDLATLARFPVIYADPPWAYDFTESPSRAIENHYPVMTLEDIKALDVPAAEDAVLFLWSTPPKLAEAAEVMAAWKFRYRTCLVWVKPSIALGKWARQRHELLLIGTRGGFPAPLKPAPDSVYEEPRAGHSVKPERFRELIEAMCPGQPYCELFARGGRPGWAAWGYEAPSWTPTGTGAA